MAVPPKDMHTIRPHVQCYRLRTLLEELTGMPIAQLWPEDITRWCRKLFPLATSGFNGSCGQYIPNHNRWRLCPKNSKELRFPCNSCPREARHTLYNHLLYKYNYKLQAPRAPLLNFYSPRPAAYLVLHPEQVWLVFPRLPRQVLHPNQKMPEWDDQEQQESDSEKSWPWNDDRQQGHNRKPLDDREKRDHDTWQQQPHSSKQF
ncbi:unnamed protein product [Cylicostephanus goldi]|uniref:Uncharacterized protein n=1 Tax=Cylicostephanus goldi TaxID=71465 RepID=A0A3P7NWZ3_CYLGO|nr:unnamed protein product [Cylicostephanus goldi]